MSERAAATVTPIAVDRLERPSASEMPLLVVSGLSALACVLAFNVWGLNLWALGLVHVTTLAVTAFVLRDVTRRGNDASIALLALLAGAAIGPLGIAGAALAGLIPSRPNKKLLDQWYDRISQATTVDPVTRLSDDVSVGRAVNLQGAMPSSFLATMEAGSLSERQTVLGIIARRFHSDYIPVLQSALRSEEPVIRVQAAAVAARVRPEIARQFHASLTELPVASAGFFGALALLQRIEAFISSGLLDESDRLRGLEISARLSDVVLSGARQLQSSNALSAVTRLQRETIERLLIDRREFAELRSLRAAASVLASRRNARVRRLGGETFRPIPQSAPVRELPA